jgi:hypothetical protein
MTTPPTYRKVNPGASAILQITLTSESLPLSTLNEYADINIGQRLSTLPGVAQVSIFGVQKYAVRVQVDPDLLAMRGIGLDDVQRALAAASSTTPVGGLSGPQKAATLQADTTLTQASGYVPLIIAYRNGAPVRLGDVARVVDSVQNDKLGNWYNGKRAITVAVFRLADANTVEVVKQVKALLPALRADLPGAVEFNVLNDRSAPIEAAVTDMKHTLLLTVVLVVLVIFRSAALSNHHPGARFARLNPGHLRSDVSRRILPQQCFPDGPDIGGRIRGRRRDCHAREHRPAQRSWDGANGGSPQGLPRDYVHHHLDDALVGGSFHPCVLHGRDRRAGLSRVCHRHRYGHSGFRFRVAHPHANALQSFFAPARFTI